MAKRLNKRFCKRGHDISVCGRDSDGHCKECRRLYHVKYYAENKEEILLKGKKDYEANREIINERHKQYNAEHRGEILVYHKKWYVENKEEILLQQKIYNEEHPEIQKRWQEAHKEEIKQYRKDHPEIYKAADLKKATNRNLRIPKWADWGNINKIVKNCPKDMTIDHVIPLQGKKVSGLHVSWNLQYLTLSANSKKRNIIDLIKISKWYGELLKQEGLK